MALRPNFRLLVITLALVLLVGGCLPTAPLETPVAVSSPTPANLPTPTPAQLATPTSAPVTLVVWLPDTFEPGPEYYAAGVMSQQLNTFADSRPDTFISVRYKKASGPGGIFDLLRTAALVAPSAMPDVAVLSLTEMQAAAGLGVLQPLDSWLAAGLAEDLFPFAVSAGQVDGKWYGLPYAIDLEHLAYDTRRFTSTLALTWTHILSANVPYLFPVGSSAGVLPDSVIVQYMANGGTLTDARGQPVLDEAPLADTLSQFYEAYKQGLIPPEALSFSSTDETWPVFKARKAPLANVRASRYLTVENTIPWLGYAAIPARSGPARSIARGWALVLVTRDPARQPRAASLIMWLLSAANNAAWTQAVGLLPSRPGALEQWVRTDSYFSFLRQELGRAVAPPPTNVITVIGPVFQRALADVLGGKATPHDAAAAAVAQLKGTSP